jgi:putative glutamine amidotransferase
VRGTGAPPSTAEPGRPPAAPAAVRVAVTWPRNGPADKLALYLDALREVGADPLVVQPGCAPPAITALLLPGGGDVAPGLYGQEPHPLVSGVDPELDAFELQLAARALAEGIPVLGVCRGHQVLNVAAGGDLIQHVEGHRGTLHRVSARGPLAAYDGAAVNSSHHQAVGRLAPGFEVLAWAPDGVVEAIRRPGPAFALGVQWHPERQPRHPGIFAALLGAARGG